MGAPYIYDISRLRVKRALCQHGMVHPEVMTKENGVVMRLMLCGAIPQSPYVIVSLGLNTNTHLRLTWDKSL